MSRRRTKRVRERRSFADINPVWLGLIGTLGVLTLVTGVLEYDKLPFVDSGRTYHAVFSEAGGLSSGDEVVYAGLKVGSVTSVRLHGDTVVVGFTITDGGVRLGDRTHAEVDTVTLLGRKALAVEPAGVGRLTDGEIPLSQTTAPYDVTEALSQLTTQTGAIDVASVSQALEAITGTFRGTPAELSAAVNGLGKVADTIGSRDQELQELLAHTSSLSGVLAARNQQITALLTDGASLFAALNQRHDAIISLLASATAVAQQFHGLVTDQQNRLKPALDQLDHVLDLLNKNKQNIEDTLNRVGPYATSLGESVGSGPFFDAFLSNLVDPGQLPLFPTSLLPTKK